VDLQRPVFLKRWPNFTRLVITPDAMRIAALLIQGPKMPLDVIAILNTKPQYVFVFISACHTLGLLWQSDHPVKSDTKPDQSVQTKNPKKGLLSKILSKLRFG
jgi:hypothetical protein